MDYAAIADNLLEVNGPPPASRLHTGWLHMKQRSFLAGWRRRYCVLKRDRHNAYTYLHVYKGSNTVNEPLLESIALRQVKSHWFHGPSKASFVLEVFGHGSPTTYFSCSDERIFRVWETSYAAAGVDVLVDVTDHSASERSTDSEASGAKEGGLFERLGKAYMRTFLADAVAASDIAASKRLPRVDQSAIERKIERRLQKWFTGAANCGACSVNGVAVAGPADLPEQMTLHMVSPGGWKWHVTEVYTTAPRTTFRWRQVGYFYGTFQGVPGNGDMVELDGFCHMDFDAMTKAPTGMQLFYQVDSVLAALQKYATEAANPTAATAV
ncbi:hypothetical protein ACHHYP_13824 [Achlya hypogyna]|uniref:PH domain-containing protein n=1 Tax=Achlya hypogyna TaxID=1202772 RepID=A0A1V9ZFB2_ACHHY|nr:hypothetical protein ACHHYP_13824 [Achlya hypogyna]